MSAYDDQQRQEHDECPDEETSGAVHRRDTSPPEPLRTAHQWSYSCRRARRVNCRRCPPTGPGRASRSSCPPTTRPSGSGRRSTSCSATCIDAASIARDGAPGAAQLPEHIEVLVVDDGSTDATVAARRGATRERGAAPDGTSRCASCASPTAARAPRSGPGCSPRPADLIVFADADMATPPDQLPLLVAALADHDVALGSRIQPDGSDMRATQPGYRRLLGKVVPRSRVDLGRRPGPGHAVRVQGLHAGGRAGPVRAPADHEHRVRRRADLPRPAARLPDRDRPDPLVRQARIADARQPGPGAARRVGPLPDPAHPPRQSAGRDEPAT